MRRVVWAWAFGSVFFNVVAGAPLAAFVRRLGGSDFDWGVVSAAPMLTAVSQIAASIYLERAGRRKPLFLISGLIHRLVWIPIALLPWLMPRGRSTLAVMVGLVIAGSVSGQAVGPAFLSWMSDLVPLRVRGAFFSRRMRVGTAMALLSSTLAGAVLDRWTTLPAYSIVFAFAALFGALDILLFVWVPEPDMAASPSEAGLTRQILVPFSDSAFRRFLAFTAAFAFSINFMTPSLWLFVMEQLGMGRLPANLTLLGAHLAAVSLTSPLWGRMIDRFGNRPVLRVASVVVSLSPLAWIAAGPSITWTLWAVVFVNGIFAAGVDLASFGLSLRLFPRERQTMYFALFAVLVGLSAGAAPIAAGALAELLKHWGPVTVMRWRPGPYRLIFLTSLVCRIVTTLVLLPRIREPRARSARAMLRGVADDVRGRLRELRSNPTEDGDSSEAADRPNSDR